jgi:peptide deformylase
MAKRKILVVDNPNERRILRAKAKKVSRFEPYLERLVEDLWETMRAAPGVGLAAPQIGESIRVLVAEYEDQAVALVNPEIIKRSEEEELGTEGCLSIPGYVGDDVSRALAITIKARDPKGKEIRVKAEGWFARILQHEIDHLDGILYTDRIPAEKVREVTAEDVESEGGAPVEHDGAGAAKKSRPRRAPASATTGGES